jgi:DNA-binding MarR family transcriptional regulator
MLPRFAGNWAGSTRLTGAAGLLKSADNARIMAASQAASAAAGGMVNMAQGQSRRASGDLGPRADGLAEGIARLRRALRRGARVADPGNTLAVAQLELLSAVVEHPGARPGQLARLLHMRPNTVTTIVNALRARGMLDRVTAAGDKRAVELTATEAGREAVLSWQATNAAVLHLALSTLPGAQRRSLAAAAPALDALARAIDRLADRCAATDPDAS